MLDGIDGSHRPLPADLYPDYKSDFSPDGASLLLDNPFSRSVIVRRADGSTYSLGTWTSGWFPSFTSWAGGSGQYAVVVLENDASTLLAIWRYQLGKAPVKLGTLPYTSDTFAADAHSTRLVYQAPDSDVMSMNTGTGTVTALTNYCVPLGDGGDCQGGGGKTIDSVLDVNPADGRVLLAWSELTPTVHFNGFGWLTPGAPSPTKWHAATADSYALGAVVSPDGTLVALEAPTNTGADSDYNEIRSAQPGGALLTNVKGGNHTAWQPCPNGVCPVFVGPAKPSAPQNVKAYPGATDPEVTAKVAWTPPATANPAVTGYQVNVVRVSSTGAAVSSKVFAGPATARNATFWLLATRYKFRVRAQNDLGWGPWSPYSNIVTAR